MCFFTTGFIVTDLRLYVSAKKVAYKPPRELPMRLTLSGLSLIIFSIWQIAFLGEVSKLGDSKLINLFPSKKESKIFDFFDSDELLNP